MSQYPPPPIFGTTFNPNGHMESSFASYDHGLPQYPYPCPNASSLYGQGQANDRPMIPYPNANTRSFRSNAQGARTPSSGNEVLYDGQTQRSASQYPFAPGAFSHEARPISQPPTNPTPSSSGNVFSSLHLAAKVQNTNLEGSDTGPPELSELEDGELDDGETKKTTGRSRASTTTSSGISQHKRHENEGFAHRDTGCCVPNVPGEPLPGLIQGSLAVPNSQGSSASQILPHPMQNGFTGNADDPLFSRTAENTKAQHQPSMSTSTQGSKERSLQLVDEKTEEAKKALRDLHSQGFDFNRIVNAGLNPNVLRKLYTAIGVPATVSSLSLQQRIVKPEVLAESTPSAAIVGSYAQLSKSSQRQPNGDVLSNDTTPHVVTEEFRINSQPTVATAKDEDKLVQGQASLVKLSKSSGLNSFGRASGIKAGETKILDRKQYIARMLAAKAGKSAASATTTVPPKTSSITDSGASSQDRFSDGAAAIIPATVEQVSGASDDIALGIQKEDSDVEAKRKAQTDLARQKIEALKLRESNQEQAGPATSSDAKRHSERSQVTGAPTIPTETSISAPRPLTSRQSSYFSPASQKPPFSIPGLFMISDAPEPVNTSLLLANEGFAVKSQNIDYSTFESSQQGLRPNAAVSAQSPTADKTWRSSDISIDVNPTLPATISTTTSINRKRQKASDFIDSPPTRIKRPLGHQEDTSVIIDVSDDEISNSTSEDESLHMEIADCRNTLPRSQAIAPGNGKEISVKSLPTMSNLTPHKKSAVMTPPTAQVFGQSGDLKGLKSKEMEIEVMNRKIAELEQRIAIKAKQTTSRTHSPGTSSRVTISPPPGDASHQIKDTSNMPLNFLNSLDGDVARAQDSESFNALVEAKNSAATVQADAEHQLEKVELAKAEAERFLAAEISRATLADESLLREEELQILPEKEHSNLREGEQRFMDEEQRRIQDEEHRNLEENQSQQAREGEIEDSQKQEVDRHLWGQEQVRAHEARQEWLQEQEQKRCLDDQRQARRSEIESGLPLLDAEVERTRKRLESLRQEIAGLETELQKGIEGRQGLVDELNDLSQTREALPGPMDLDSCDVGDVPKRATSIEEIPAVTKPSTTEMVPNLDPKQLSGTAENGRLIQEKSTLTRTTDARVLESELEDVMDISRNDFEGAKLSLYSPKPLTKSQDTFGVTDDDENYEPPSKVSISQRQEPNPVLLYPDPEKAKASLPAATQNQPSPDQDAKPINMPNLGEPSPAANADTAGDEQSQLSLSRSPSLTDASDPDEYEPPEPAPLGEVAPRPPAQLSSVHSENSFSPPKVDTNDFVAPVNSNSTLAVHEQVQKLESYRQMGHFTPYESPLKQFKSFRYHPQYLEEVSSGFRSLTYSHTINPEIPLCHYELDGVCNDDSCQSQHLRSIGLSDDKILVDLGAKPDDGSSPDEFGNGLREIIHDIRSRKIRDFNIVAGEITAYRAKFLGDSSKILPL